MLSRLRSTILAWGAALVLVLAASGLVAAAALVGDTTPTTDGAGTPPAVTDTTATFEDANGDGIDDDCQDGTVPDQAAADAAIKAADTDGDGTISVSEAAHTDWVGGANCNHGGYVSGVAGGQGDDAGAEPAKPTRAECEAATSGTPTSTEERAPTDTSPSAHGEAVSKVAHSDAVGGKNCNHGGAVSEASKKDHRPNAHASAGKQPHGKKPDGKGPRPGHGKP
jgi:hypothetical protein